MWRRAGGKNVHAATLAGILGVYLALAVSASLTKIPVCDEGFYADPAMNLVANGNMGSPVIESAGTFLKGIERYTYWEMPVYIVTQAGWYELFGAGLFSMRALSIVAGLVALICWYITALEIGGRRSIAILTVLFAAVDTTFLSLAATGRSDMLSVAFGAAAQACYLLLRERNLKLALLAGHSLVVASGLTHPVGGLISLASIALLHLYFDRSRLTLSHLLPVAAPYLVGSIGWGAYIVKNPEVFWAQFSGNSAERLWPWKYPLLALKREILERFFGGYRIGSSSWTPLANLRLLILVAYLAGLVTTMSSKGLRRRRLASILTAQAGLTFFILLFFEGAKQPWYLIHVVWIFAAGLAVSIDWYWRRRPAWRPALGFAILCLIGVELGYPALLLKQNRYRNSYYPLVAMLANRAKEPRSVMASAELGFGLGFERVLDDHHLGYYSGKKPAFIVLDPGYRGYLERFRRESPEVYSYYQSVLMRRYRQIFSNGYYVVLARNNGAAPDNGIAGHTE